MSFLASIQQLITRRVVLTLTGVLVFVYALIVLVYVPTVPDLGLTSIFSTSLKERPRFDHLGPELIEPAKGDLVVEIADQPVRVWGELVKAPFNLQNDQERIEAAVRDGKVDWAKLVEGDGNTTLLIKVRFERPGTSERFTAWCELGRLSISKLYPSVLWFFLKAFLFLVGALVFWKKPDDAAAPVFFVLCVVTLGAYMGGYHWNHIATNPFLLSVFMVCGVLLPAVSLHFYLLFPRKNAWFQRWPKRTLAGVYGPSLFALTLLFAGYLWVRWSMQRLDGNSLVALEETRGALEWLRAAIFFTFSVSCVLYLACVASLLHSFWTVTDVTARNQVKCILAGVLVGALFIAWSFYVVVWDPEAFAAGATTWPMFFASVSVNAAFVVSITRFRLMEVDKLLSSGMNYFLVSFVAVLVNYAVVFLATLLFNQVFARPSLTEAFSVSATFLLLMLVMDLARSRFMKALDRRFSRSKSQLDQTLHQMSEAVAQLVDPAALAEKLLHATIDLIGAAQGAIYLRQGEPPIFRLAGKVGPAPALDEISLGFPLVEAVQSGQPLYASGMRGPALSPAQRQLQFLGGELAQPLTHEGRLLALLVLGPKDTPYRPEDVNILATLAQITVLALESAKGHHTIEQLNGQLQDKIEKIAEQQRRILALQTQLRQNFEVPGEKREAPKSADAADERGTVPPGGILGSGSVVRELLGLVRKVAATDAVILIRGESGTGKELIARAVHETSARADKPFIKVHCAALSANLLESELFGHVKGAFTGAHRDKVGRFELAHGGTLFLDEIGDVSLEVQTKLLRVLQEKIFERVGSSEAVQVDVRIITATHQNLEALIEQGRFREDLFYRLNVFPIRVPALRERVEDIPELTLNFMSRFSERFRKDVKHIDDDALAALKRFSWPGNIRQLENVIERTAVIMEGSVITCDDLPPEIVAEPRESGAGMALPSFLGLPISNLRSERDRLEREQLVRALAGAKGNKAEAARALGVARSTLVSRLKKLGLS